MTTRFPIRLIAAALFALAAVLGVPNAQDASPSLGTPVAAAQEAQTEPRYWQMYYNFAPPTDAFIAELAAEQGVAYTPGKKGEARFYGDDGRPIYPSNDGAVGVIVTITLPAGDVLTRYGKPTGRYVSPDGITFEQRSLPSTTSEGDFHVYCVDRSIDGVQKGKIAPWFGRLGGGIQYKLPDRIVHLMEASFLHELDLVEENEAA
ncbi:hypothetical protein HMPREF9162_0086 [Selenomonas sp. oral taxon 137 str. F0430]|uniref:TNT domain-containing protein n=1 Tax=Selenomonas sp. oral taxon 137 TaxID=712531 RepID=UPI0001EB1F1A|nr:TNT domain-containing protein [Selenomonas sp. oral taxon 137]EFR40336.1 hypothetical protein HMPREF9162_0086 [Selenomonas sp. oral taxon 137 str. F0430]